MAAQLSDQTRQQVMAAIAAGKPRNQIARETGVSAGSVTTIAREMGAAFDQSATKKAVQARRTYAQAERLDLLNEGFETARAMLPRCERPHELFQWAVAVGTLIDKRRLEEGEATSRAEVNNGSDARDRLARRLDDLAAQRAAREQTQGHQSCYGAP